MKKIGVNGFGRIGRYFTRMTLDQQDIDVTVVNDLGDIKTLAHLFKYDSVHGRLPHSFTIEEDCLLFENGKKIQFTQYSNPEDIPWKTLGAEAVLESTGIFRTEEKASAHFKGGAKKVVVSAPCKGGEMKTIVVGVNDDLITPEDKLLSNASCTTNSAAPIFKVIQGLGEIDSAFLTTTHSYTSDQRLHDAPHKDLRRARAAGESIIPTTTGAADAVEIVFPELKGKLKGSAIRTPVKDGSLTDITFTLKGKMVTEEEINDAFIQASKNELKGILSCTNEPLVSVDIIGTGYSCIIDLSLTSVIGNMAKIVGWYDNEAGFSNRLVDLFKKL